MITATQVQSSDMVANERLESFKRGILEWEVENKLEKINKMICENVKHIQNLKFGIERLESWGEGDSEEVSFNLSMIEYTKKQNEFLIGILNK